MGGAAPSTQWARSFPRSFPRLSGTSIMAKGLLNLSATTLAISCDGVTGVNISQLQLEISIDDYVHCSWLFFCSALWEYSRGEPALHYSANVRLVVRLHVFSGLNPGWHFGQFNCKRRGGIANASDGQLLDTAPYGVREALTEIVPGTPLRPWSWLTCPLESLPISDEVGLTAVGRAILSGTCGMQLFAYRRDGGLQ